MRIMIYMINCFQMTHIFHAIFKLLILIFRKVSSKPTFLSGFEEAMECYKTKITGAGFNYAYLLISFVLGN